jgi:hypothetical protein
VSLVENLELRHPDPRNGPRLAPGSSRIGRTAPFDRRKALGQVHESRAVGRVRLVALDERMVVELAPDGRAKDAGAAAVNHMHGLQARERGVVHKGANRLSRLLRRRTAHVELIGDVGGPALSPLPALACDRA